jgi:hypothetical protein
MSEEAMNTNAVSTTYRETQRLGGLNRALLVAVEIVLVASVLIPIGNGLYRQLVLGQPWGDRPAPNAVLFGAGVVTLLVSLLPLVLLSLTLTVETTTDALVVRLETKAPIALMRPKRIPREEIVDAAVSSRFPLGAGATRGWRQEAYKVSGGDGVELTLRSGKTVFVGSGQPRELLAAIEALRAS